MMRSMKYGLGAGPLLLAACLAHPFEPAGARPFSPPPPLYAVWWQRMETCAQITAPLDRVEWYEMPGDQFATPDGPRWGWWGPPHEIYIATTHLSDEQLVEHEMLHDLLQTGAHPAVFQTCGVREPLSATRGLPGMDVERDDRRPPVQPQHR
jgi:hypothetical protein